MKESIDKNTGDEKNSVGNSPVTCTKVKIVVEIKRRQVCHERIISSLLRLVLAICLGVGGCRLIDKMPNVETATPRSSAPSVTCPCHFCFCWRCVGK